LNKAISRFRSCGGTRIPSYLASFADEGRREASLVHHQDRYRLSG